MHLHGHETFDKIKDEILGTLWEDTRKNRKENVVWFGMTLHSFIIKSIYTWILTTLLTQTGKE